MGTMPSGIAQVLKATNSEEGYATSIVETHDGEWTAEISRGDDTDVSGHGRVSALIDVGSISHLIDAYKKADK